MFDRASLFLLRWAALLAAVLSLTGMAQAETGRKLALVVGNAAYQYVPRLTTPANDAQAMSTKLRDLGFEVTVLTDVGPEVFEAVLNTFADQAKDAETVLFYYSGHAFQLGGVNRLVPVTAKLESIEAVEAETWALDRIANRLKGNAPELLIFLDACRTNPLPDTVQKGVGGQVGLAQYDGGSGTFVAFATAPGQVAWDKTDDSENSPFTTSLLDRIATPGQSISDLMIGVRNDVDVATGGKQTPWEQSSLLRQYFFDPAGTEMASAAPAEADALPDFDVVEDNTQILPEELAVAANAVIQSIDGKAIRLAALSSDTRSLSVIAGVPAGAAARVAGVEPGAAVTQTVKVPANVPEGIQRELQRIGCYGMKVDGDWGNGSRNAMKQYYNAKKVDVGELEPTVDVYIALAKEPEKTCDEVAPVPVAKKPAPAKKPSTAKKPATTSTKKPAAEAAPKKPAVVATPKKGGCKFMVVAIVCS